MTERFSFEVVDAADYDELRPGYAWEAVQWVVERGRLGPGSVVVDLAAGTGQLSRLLAPLELDVVAVEPAPNMRAVIEERLPSTRPIDGTAEDLPMADRSVDGVVVGNAFHHFEREAAYSEIRRVLRPAAPLALFWAWPLEEEQLATPGMREIYDAVEETQAASGIGMAYRRWAERPPREEGLGPWERREFRLTHVLPAARLADLWGTSSDVASLPPPQRDELLGRIRRLSEDLPEMLRLPSRTVVDLCAKD